jgi:hypothetical protein
LAGVSDPGYIRHGVRCRFGAEDRVQRKIGDVKNGEHELVLSFAFWVLG